MMSITIKFKDASDLQRQVEKLFPPVIEGRQISPMIPEEFTDPVHGRKPSRKHKRWTSHEIELVTGWYKNKTYTCKEMGKSLGRSGGSVAQLLTTLFKKGLQQRTHRAGKMTVSSI